MHFSQTVWVYFILFESGFLYAHIFHSPGFIPVPLKMLMQHPIFSYTSHWIIKGVFFFDCIKG